MKNGRYLVCADTQPVDEAPEVIKLLPMGHVSSKRGDFDVDDKSLQLIQAQFKVCKNDLPIDYEHQTLKDVQAPAAGWITEVFKQDGAICGKVNWTDKASEYLRNREYRYLSPVIMANKQNGREHVIGLHSAGLTNLPAINGMYTIVNSASVLDMELDLEPETEKEEEEKGGTKMDLKKFIELLGLPDEATEEDILKAIKALQEKEAETKDAAETKELPAAEEKKEEKLVANKTILGLLGLKEDAKTEDVAVTVMALKAKSAGAEAEAAVEKALQAGKITAAQKDWALEYAQKDTKGFEAFALKAPAIVPMGTTALKDAPETNADVNMLALKGMGMDEAAIKNFLQGEKGD